MDKHAKDDSLYPKDVKTRAIINARLDFDCGTLWPRLITAYVSYKMKQITTREILFLKFLKFLNRGRLF